jgi:hypothetical protein
VWDREIGRATGLDIVHCKDIVSESIWVEQFVVGNGIKKKVERYTVEISDCGRVKLEVQLGWISFIVM